MFVMCPSSATIIMPAVPDELAGAMGDDVVTVDPAWPSRFLVGENVHRPTACGLGPARSMTLDRGEGRDGRISFDDEARGRGGGVRLSMRDRDAHRVVQLICASGAPGGTSGCTSSAWSDFEITAHQPRDPGEG